MTMEEQTPHMPKGITSSYLEKILKEYHNDNKLKVVGFEIKLAKGFAFHYGGVTNKIHVKLEKNNAVCTTSMIVKEPFADSEDGILQLENEMSLYKKVLPVLNSKITRITKGGKICPNSIAINDTNDFIILEDSSTYRYNFFNSKMKMDLSKMKVVIKQLAYLHASSAVFENRNPSSLTTFTKKHHKHLDDFYKVVHRSLSNNIKHFTIPVSVEQEKHFKCLVHGSLWEPNILFKLENTSDEDVKNVLFINYHYSFYGSPAIDLQKCIHSVVPELSENVEKELIEFYYFELKDILQRMIYREKIPTPEEFWTQYKDYRFYGLQQAIYINPFVISGKLKSLNLNKGLPSEKLCDEVFQNEEVIAYLRKYLE